MQRVEKAVFNWLQKRCVWSTASVEKVSTFSFKAAALTPAEKEYTMSKRTIEKHIKYNSEEWDIVSKKAAALGQRAGTYIRRISVNGTIKYFDMKQFNHQINHLSETYSQFKTPTPL